MTAPTVYEINVVMSTGLVCELGLVTLWRTHWPRLPYQQGLSVQGSPGVQTKSVLFLQEPQHLSLLPLLLPHQLNSPGQAWHLHM